MGIYLGKEYSQPAKQSGPRNQYGQRGGKPPYNNSRPQPKAHRTGAAAQGFCGKSRADHERSRG